MEQSKGTRRIPAVMRKLSGGLPSASGGCRAPRFGGRFVSSSLLLMRLNPLGWASGLITMGAEQSLLPLVLIVAIDAGPWKEDT